MKILVVCQHFYPEQFRINDICKELIKRGNKVTVLTGLPNYPTGKLFPGFRFWKKRKEIYEGIKIIRTPIICRGTSLIRMALNYVSFAINGSLKALFMKKNFDVVYVYQLSPVTMAWPGIVVSKIKHIPLVIHVLDQWPVSITAGGISKKSLIYKFLYRLSKTTYKKATTISISSQNFKKYFENELEIKDKEIIYAPSYAEDNYKNIKTISNDTFDLVFAGNIGPAQSVETIIEAANILNKDINTKFHIVGDGLSYKKCKDLAEKYNLNNVTFYGFCKVEEIKKYYDLADAFLITMDDNEVVNNTLPAKLQSYMLAGKPIFGAVSGEARTVIEMASCGKICSSLDYKELANIILNEKDNSTKLKKYGNNGYEYYQKHFQKDKCMDDLEKILKDSRRS